MKNTEKDTAAKNRQDALRELTAQLEQSIHTFMDSEKYKNFLSKMALFHSYSLRNQLLILMQRPDATRCASYGTLKKFNRQVKKGETGIKIICPVHRTKKILQNLIDPETGLPERMADGSIRQAEVEMAVPFYKVGYTFDISQTDGVPLPELTKDLEGSLNTFQKDLKDALLQICPVPVSFRPIQENAHGYFDLMQKEIVIDSCLSEKHTLKTLIHEMAHARLHNRDIPGAPLDAPTQEVQAESIAYVVCRYFGLDTSEYTFGYVSGWSTGKDTVELKSSLEVIHNTANDIITEAEQYLEKKQTPMHDIRQAVPEIHRGRCL